MSLIATAKNKAAKGSVAAAFKNEAGAIDLASIMVGIIVIGLIGGVIAATVFAVIPWAQDNAAKQQLDSVAAAQSAYVGLSADAGAASFGTDTQLAGKSLLPAVPGLVIQVSGTGASAHYGAALTSSSGSIFYIGDRKTQATKAVAATPTTAAAAAAGLGNTAY